MRNDFKKSRRDQGSSNFDSMQKFSRNFDSPREMHKTTCADCGKDCDVPFKPTEGRPVYCRDCFAKHKPKRF
jgi:CxxC-x17-CxxC domain-containing protein